MVKRWHHWKSRRRAEAALERGIQLQEAGDLDGAELSFHQGLHLAEQIDDRLLMVHAYGLLGNVLQERSAFTAIKMYEQALVLVREEDGPTWTVPLYGNLARTRAARGELDEAEQDYRVALAAQVGDESRSHRPQLCRDLGTLLEERGDLDAAEALFREAMQINRELGHPRAWDYSDLGGVYMKRDDLDESEKWYREALALDEPLGQTEGLATIYVNLGIIAQKRDDRDEAAAMWQRAHEVYQALGNAEMTTATAGWIALLAEDDA